MVANVEVGVPTRPWVHVDVQQAVGLCTCDDGQACLFARLAKCGLPRCFPGIDVTTRLQPHRQPLVQVQHHAVVTRDDRGGGHMGRRGLLVERILERIECCQERFDGIALTGVDRLTAGDRLLAAWTVHRIFQIRPSAGASPADNSFVGNGSSGNSPTNHEAEDRSNGTGCTTGTTCAAGSERRNCCAALPRLRCAPGASLSAPRQRDRQPSRWPPPSRLM